MLVKPYHSIIGELVPPHQVHERIAHVNMAVVHDNISALVVLQIVHGTVTKVLADGVGQP